VSLPVAILAGGLATRMRPLTERQPKILIDVAGSPFAVRQLELLQQWGISHVVYCLGYLGEQVAETLGDGSRFQMKFEYLFDGPRLLGTGGALKEALPRLGPAFFVMYGDSYLECDFTAVERAFLESAQQGLMTVFRNENRWGRSNVDYESGRIIRYDKSETAPAMRYIDYGLGVLTPQAFAPWSGNDDPFDLSLVYQTLMEQHALAGFEVHERFYEIGSAEGLEETRARVEARSRSIQ
jgi:N-acetyl-alpha-D-muramate 1-phosphate uridylyltransferase